MIAAAFLFTLFAIVGLTFAIHYLMTAAGRRAGQRIARTHRDLQEIVEHGRVPAAWVEEARRRTRGAHGATARRRAQEQRFLLRRLAELRSYCRSSSLVDGPDTRALLLDGLSRAEREWTAQGLPESTRGRGGEELP